MYLQFLERISSSSICMLVANNSFACLPRINVEDVRYIAVASRIAETNVRLDLMNSLISENTARSLQNEERVQYLARQKNNHASYSNVVTGNDKSSQLH